MRNLLLFVTAVVIPIVVAAPADGRLFKAFDFEERQLGNDEDVPMHWAKVSAVDLPHYVVGRLTTDRARSGRYSFRMDLDGGSCVYQYDAARLPVAAGGHYRACGFCQTTPLRFARARLTLTLADAAGQPLGTSAASESYAATTPDTGWHELSAELSADDPRAAFLIVRMELDQPARLGVGGDPGTLPQDVHGSAWFDDVVVAQVPRVTLSTDRPGNVFRRGDRPQMSAVLDDPSTDDLAQQLVVTDADGHRVYQHTGGVAAAEPAGPGKHRMAVPLPIVPAGWYRATLTLAAAGDGSSVDDPAAFAGAQSLSYVQLADDGAIGPADRRFGVVATGLSPADWAALPAVLPMLSAGRVTLPVGVGDDAAFDGLLESLAARGIAAVGCLPTGGTDLAALAVMVGRHAGAIDRWQFGPDGTDAFATDPAARRAYGQAFAAVGALTEHPDLAVPWPIGFDPPAGTKGLPSSLALSVPASVLPNEIPPYLKDAQARATAGGPAVASVSLEPLDEAKYGTATRAADLAKRIVYTLAAGLARVELPVPLVAGTGEPTDLFAVERTAFGSLSGATYRGRLPLAEGVEAFLFERADPPADVAAGSGVVVLWSDGADRPITVRLGDQLARTDLSGNTAPLPPTPADGPPTVVVRAGASPQILTGVDVPLARFRAGVVLDPPVVESVLLRPQVRHLHLTNPYARPVSGIVRLRGPAGWTLSPPTFTFELAAGESLDRDVGIDLPVNARTGRNVVRADVDLQADRPVRMSMPLAMTVGLSDVGVQSTAFRDGPTVVVQQRITNYGEHPVDYTAYAACPNQPRVERLVVGLAAGQTTLKRYRFAAGPGPVRVRAGIRETDGPRVLNEELTVEGDTAQNEAGTTAEHR